MTRQNPRRVENGELSSPALRTPALADRCIVENLVESFESLFDLLALDQDAIDDEIGRYVAAIAADRERLGTLDREPIGELDVILAGLLTLIKRFERGEVLTARQRQALATMLRLGLGKTMEGLTKEKARREASRRGGKARRAADPEKVMEVWREKLALCNGKKTAADKEAADELKLAERTVRTIRLADDGNK